MTPDELKGRLAAIERENSQLRSIISLVRRALAETDVETFDEMDSLNLERAERLLLIEALRRSLGNRPAAARMLGIARSTLFQKMKRLNVTDGPRWRRKQAPEKDWVIEGLQEFLPSKLKNQKGEAERAKRGLPTPSEVLELLLPVESE